MIAPLKICKDLELATSEDWRNQPSMTSEEIRKQAQAAMEHNSQRNSSKKRKTSS